MGLTVRPGVIRIVLRRVRILAKRYLRDKVDVCALVRAVPATIQGKCAFSDE